MNDGIGGASATPAIAPTRIGVPSGTTPGGTIACNATCSGVDTSGCQAPPGCGDGTLNEGEQCEGSNLGSFSCQALGFAGGTLSCNDNCSINTAACTTCGNGSVQNGEQCDGSALNNQTCQSLGFGGGTLGCTSSCSYDTSACTQCGNGTVNSGEQCATANLGGASC